MHLKDTMAPRPPETKVAKCLLCSLVVEVSLIAVFCFAGQPNLKMDIFTTGLVQEPILITDFCNCQMCFCVRPPVQYGNLIVLFHSSCCKLFAIAVVNTIRMTSGTFIWLYWFFITVFCHKLYLLSLSKFTLAILFIIQIACLICSKCANLMQLFICERIGKQKFNRIFLPPVMCEIDAVIIVLKKYIFKHIKIIHSFYS